MAELPSILVTDGWITDQNNNLTEVVIPSTVSTLQVPTKVTFSGATLNAVPSTAAVLQEFVGTNMLALNDSLFRSFTNLTSVTFNELRNLTDPSYSTGTFSGCTKLVSAIFPKLESLTSSTGVYPSTFAGCFRGCTALTTVSMPSLISITGSNTETRYGGVFSGCTGLVSISFPKLQTITNSIVFEGCTSLESVELPSLTSILFSTGTEKGIFYGASSLHTLTLPKIQQLKTGGSNRSGAFSGCTQLTSITLGSEGNPVSIIESLTFNNCTQSNLTITIYTAGGASLSGSPWGATNATIVYEEA